MSVSTEGTSLLVNPLANAATLIKQDQLGDYSVQGAQSWFPPPVPLVFYLFSSSYLSFLYTTLSVYCPLPSPPTRPHTVPFLHLQYPRWPLICITLTVPQHRHACIHHHASKLSKQRHDVMWIRLHHCHKSDDRRAYNSPELRAVTHNAALWKVDERVANGLWEGVIIV